MMKIKTIKKAIAMFSLVAVSVCSVGISAVGATPTGLDRGQGDSDTPIIKAKWEMYGVYEQLSGADEGVAAGAQFDPSLEWGSTMQYSICAIVGDRGGSAPIDGVYADIYYPEDRAFHPEAPAPFSDQINGGGGIIEDPATPYDWGMSGCDQQREDEVELNRLDKMTGYNLFCDTVKNNNNNLPSFFEVDGIAYDYDEICNPVYGELMEETAYVYCGNEVLWWEDPAGDYRVDVFALSTYGQFSNLASNDFTYLPWTLYEVDFSDVDYGTVLLNNEKKVIADDDFTTPNRPTVRNIGNTRLYLGVVQNDMGMGTTDDVYNVSYRARVGNDENNWQAYYPEEHVWLEDVLDLSEEEKVDFAVTVTKFPNSSERWIGSMTLDAKSTAFRQCLAS